MFAHAVVLGEDASGQRLRSELPLFVRQYPDSKGSRARVDPDSLHSDPIGHGLQDTLPAAVLARLGRLWALLACTSIDLVDQRLVGVDATRNSQASRAPRTHRASLTVTGTRQVFATTDLASFTRGRGGASGCAPGRYGARFACLLALLALEAACRTLVARVHVGVGRDRAGAALRLPGATGWRIVALGNQHAFRVSCEVSGDGVGALLAWQRRAGTLGAERAGLAGDALLLALVGLVRACRALVARGHARVGRDRARAARRLPGATGWRVVALDGRRACRISCEVGGVGVRALLARQRRAGALGAVRAGLAGDAHLLAFALLVRAGRALGARTLAGVGLDGAGAALGLLGAACWREVARFGRCAVGSGAKVGPVGVCALAARQRRRRALRAVRARHAHVALCPAGFVHELARAALVTLGLLVQRLHGTRAARRLLGAARWCEVAPVRRRALVRAGQRRAGARWAVRASLACNAGLLALALLISAGRALDARAHARVGRDGAGAARRLHGATGWRVVAVGSWRAFRVSCEASGDRIRALLARQRRAGARWAVRPGLAGVARLLSIIGLERAGGAFDTEGGYLPWLSSVFEIITHIAGHTLQSVRLRHV
eukprot:scaffold133377_cov69-Phaeocystis_antarctica.AAC.2